MVRVCAPEPTATELGEREVIVGTGFPTEKFTAFDVPPPGAGFVTVTGNVPPVATSVAGESERQLGAADKGRCAA